MADEAEYLAENATSPQPNAAVTTWHDVLDYRGWQTFQHNPAFAKSAERETSHMAVSVAFEAKHQPSLEARMQRLAECERLLLAAMPIIPTQFQVYSSLVKPYVRGWAFNPLNEHHFKYVWIDQKWRPL
jgi:ABC-type oligopeptide transport system substrate-binding subunit